MSYSASTTAGSGERIAATGDVELCHETFGDGSDPALVLIMGLATQMIGWRDGFCESLAAQGFFVVRFDNRDVGRSTRLDNLPVPTFWQLARRDKSAASYTLEDMALDTVGLLDHLEIDRAHVVGASMGAMIAQTVAARYPDRVRSLVSMMGSSGAPSSGAHGEGADDRSTGGSRRLRGSHMKTSAIIGSPKFERDEDDLRWFSEATFDRGFNPAAAARQLAAINASSDRTPLLRQIGAPTLVIHGSDDTLVRPSGGRATAKPIAGARLVEMPGIGHDLPRDAWPQIIDAIAENAARGKDDA
jgi:pimeloyl-ACP methyl ester carboxylesterase